MTDRLCIYTVLPVIFAISFFFSFIFQRIILRFSYRNGLMDRVAARKIKKDPVPRLGGTGIFISLFISLGTVLLFCRAFYPILYEDISAGLLRGLRSPLVIVVSLIFIFVIGLLDDLFEISYKFKLALEFLIASALYFSGFRITFISIPFVGGVIYLGFLSFLITVIWIIGVTNSINLIDGVDGLAGGIIAISSFFMIIIFIINGDLHFALVLTPLLGAVSGFLPFNLYPSRILLGDGGSLMAGLLLSVFVLQTSNKASLGIILIVPLALLAIPILDTVLAFTRRLAKGRSPFRADGDHIHHRMIRNGISEKKTTAILCFSTFFFSMLALASSLITKQMRVFLWGVFFLIVIAIIVYLKYVRLGWLKKIFNGRIR